MFRLLLMLSLLLGSQPRQRISLYICGTTLDGVAIWCITPKNPER